MPDDIDELRQEIIRRVPEEFRGHSDQVLHIVEGLVLRAQANEARKATNDLLERQSLLNMTHEEQVSISRIARRWLVINSLILMALMLATAAVLSDCRNLRLQLQALEDQHDYLDRSVRYEETLDAIYFKPLIWSGKEEMPYGKAVDEAGKAWFPADYEEIDHKRRGR